MASLSTAVSKKIQKELKCPISLEVMKDPVLAKCSHSFERSEIESWLQKKTTCPVCRENIDKANLVANRALQNIIQLFLTLNEEAKIPNDIQKQKDNVFESKEILKNNFDDYTKDEIKQFLINISEATIKRYGYRSTVYRFENLDAPTKISLSHFCQRFSDHSKHGFNTCVKQYFKEYSKIIPSEQLLNALGREVLGYREF